MNDENIKYYKKFFVKNFILKKKIKLIESKKIQTLYDFIWMQYSLSEWFSDINIIIITVFKNLPSRFLNNDLVID